MAGHQVRRATIEDLPKLTALWGKAGLPTQDLAKQLLEFQIIEEESGQLAAAVALKVAGAEGLLHHEAFAHPEQSDDLRARLWERALTVVRNHGLCRVWTQIPTHFWQINGFHPPNDTLLAKLPTPFAGTSHPWLCLQLKEESASPISLDKEFALFKEAERESTQRLFRQARVAKIIAVFVAIIVLALVIVWAFSFFKVHPRLGH